MANEFFTTEYTEVIQKLVREVVNDPSTYIGSKYLPAIALPVQTVRTEVIEASGGLTNQHLIGTDTKYIQRSGNRVQEFKPPQYKEAIHFNEADILYLRQLGNNGRNVRGIRQYLDIAMDRLNRRLEARIEYERWGAIFTGGFSWMSKTFSYGIPASNLAVPLGAAWSLDNINANASANPLIDIRYWVTGGLSAFRKYKITKLVMNPNTARWILDNTNTRSYVQNALANPAVAAYTVEQVLKFFIPACPPVEIYDGWYQTESIDANGHISVSDAVYFVPNGSIFFETALPGGDKIGEFVQTVHLASGTVDAPGYGKFIVPEENIAPGTKGGPGNPYMDVIAGVYGGVKLDRPFDVLTAYVL